MNGTPCLDGGPRHAFKPEGLDVRKIRGVEQLRKIKRCVWCGTERSAPYRTPSERRTT